ncbi:Mediator of RNA polymerase II transcription subunit 7 [Gamsiella multidivaricata]|nr:Mediator of RNA polymerase II transcription subunit 7 [Gamsiella multidivaricata]
MEEASAQQQGAAFPAPPYYFQRYTQENINLLEKARADPENPEIVKSLEALPFPILALEPPPPVKKGIYWLFGRPWPVEDSLATLEEQGIEQLYPKGSIDRVKELKKLNHSAVFNFLELVHTLSTSPSEFTVKVDQIRVIFINMHHMLNEYRPHQARETLRLMMEEQLSRKKKETAALKKTCADLRKRLAALRDLKQKRLPVAGMDMDVEMALASTSTSAMESEGVTTEGSSINDMKLSRRPSSSEEKRKSLAALDPIAARNVENMARLMDLCDDIK